METDGTLIKPHVVAGLSCIGRTSSGLGIAHLKVDISNLQLTNIDLLSKYSHLQEVNLQNNKLTSLQALQTLPNLVRLHAPHNHLEDPDCTTVLHGQMEYLNLTHNKFPIIPVHSQLRFLRELYLDKNQLTSVDTLCSSLQNLRILSLQHNKLTNIEALGKIQPTLLKVHLDWNEIQDLSPLAPLAAQLEELTVQHNEVMHIDCISEFKQLSTFNIAANNLNTIEELEHLQNLRLLANLRAFDNPMYFPPMPDLRDPEEDDETDVVASDDTKAQTVQKARRNPIKGDELEALEYFSAKKNATEEKAPQPTVAEHQANLRHEIIALLPQLTDLDDTMICAEDKVKSSVIVATKKEGTKAAEPTVVVKSPNEEQ